MAEETLTSKQIGAAKSRAKMAAKKAAAAAEPEVVEVREDIHEITEEDIVKAQIKAKEAEREVKAAEVKPVEVKAEVVKPAVINNTDIVVEQLPVPNGKWIARRGAKILIKGSEEKVRRYASQF